MSTTTTRFEYLLNAMDQAAMSANPAKEGYAERRAAVLAYVTAAETEVKRLRTLLIELRDAVAIVDELGGELRSTIRCASDPDIVRFDSDTGARR